MSRRKSVTAGRAAPVSEESTAVFKSSRFSPAWGIWGLWAVLLGLGTWRVVLAARVLVRASLPVMQGGVVIQWRQLDGLLAWVAMGLLILEEPGGIAAGNTREKRLGMVAAGVIILGAMASGIALFLGEGGFAEGFAGGIPGPWAGAIGFLGDGLLAACGVLLAGRELGRVMRRMRGSGGNHVSSGPAGGLTLIELWRFVAVQWGLLMAAAVMYLRVRVPAEDIAANEAIRRLEFFLPAAAVLPNALMVGGIMAWDWVVRCGESAGGGARGGVPRVRAWLLAMAAINVAALFMVLRMGWLGIPGGVFAIGGLGLYLAGFPVEIWRTHGGRAMLMAAVMLGISWAAAAIDPFLEVTTFYGAAWRHLWSVGAVGLWLMGMGLLLIERQPAGRSIKKPAVGAMGMVIVGAAIVAGVLLACAQQQGESQVPVMEWLLAGTLPELIAILVAGAVMLRAMRLLRRAAQR